MTDANLTERQQKWFASVREGLERDTGKSLAEWAAIARTCPETGHRARLKWLKDQHGLQQNRASIVLDEAFKPMGSWDDPATLADALWADPASRAILDVIEAAAAALPDTVRTQRKGYTAWSRKVQYAAARPVKGGGAMLGLAIDAGSDPRLAVPKNESWSERLKARVALASPADVDEAVRAWLQAAWERS
jgi:hypothetical protein